MAASKRNEALFARGAILKVSSQNPLDRSRRMFRLDVTIKLSAERRLRSKTTPDQYVVALEGIAVRTLLHFAGEEPDFADKVLST
jgi:hypothetical protein